MGIDAIKELLQKSDASGSKSTILKPLTWFLSIIVTGILVLLRANAPSWLITFFSVIMALVVLLFLFVYVFCLFRDRDALRSEKFSIQKLAIEKGLYGDDLSGIYIARSPNTQQTDNNLLDNTDEGDKVI